MTDIHVPVLLPHVLSYLDIQKKDTLLDGTIGYGGHAEALSQNLGDNGRLIGLDQDPNAISHCNEKFKNDSRVSVHQTNFSDFSDILKKLNINVINKVLIDLGMSSFHLDSSNRGFSYSKNEPLDMRMDTRSPQTAASILKEYDFQSLSDIFFNYGELIHNKRLAETIVTTRKKKPIKTTEDLIDLVKKSYYFSNSRNKYIKTLAQVFQALRIETNQELAVLNEFLGALDPYLEDKSRVAVITFHSLEDRIVKQFVKANKSIYTPVFKKVIQATQDEIRSNPRAKSAKLRVFEKTHVPA
jgi:16S rRNA (cytosine1402-N4)-methyltransferase